jgi:Mg2+/Co2+ transporter CorB
METSIPVSFLVVLLVFLFILSAFFSGSETALMALDRHRLKHLAERKHQGAMLAEQLLKRPDRLIGLILLGNNFVNILITQVATLLGYKASEDWGIAVATGILTFMLLIFAEVMPKTLAAINPERIAFPASYVYSVLIRVMSPFVWLVNLFANSLLKLMGLHDHNIQEAAISYEELKTIVNSAGGHLPKNHHEMLISILNLESETVEDIMIPRQEMSGIDISEEWSEIEDQLVRSNFTRMLVYEESLDHIHGFVHMRKLLPLFKEDKLDLERLKRSLRPAYYIPEFTSLMQQLVNFRRERRRIALVVDEYGEIQGLVTIEDILERIVGEFSTAPSTQMREIFLNDDDGSALADGGMHVKDLNKQLGVDLPTDQGKTLNGLILEHLQSLPVKDMSVMINGYPIEIRKLTNKENAVKTLVIYPKYKHDSDDVDEDAHG